MSRNSKVIAKRVLKRVLVIDDEIGIRESLKILLHDEGFEVFMAENGRDALRLLEQIEAPDLILHDLEMPVMDGFQLSTTLDRNPALKWIPRVVFSARDLNSIAAQVDELGFAAYVPKTSDIELLVRVIREVLDETREAADPGDREPDDQGTLRGVFHGS